MWKQTRWKGRKYFCGEYVSIWTSKEHIFEQGARSPISFSMLSIEEIAGFLFDNAFEDEIRSTLFGFRTARKFEATEIQIFKSIIWLLHFSIEFALNYWWWKSTTKQNYTDNVEYWCSCAVQCAHNHLCHTTCTRLQLIVTIISSKFALMKIWELAYELNTKLRVRRISVKNLWIQMDWFESDFHCSTRRMEIYTQVIWRFWLIININS